MALCSRSPDTSDCVPTCAAIVKRPAIPWARAAAGSRLNTAAATSQQRAFIVPPFGTVLTRRLALRAECSAPRAACARSLLQSRDMLRRRTTGSRACCCLRSARRRSSLRAAERGRARPRAGAEAGPRPPPLLLPRDVPAAGRRAASSAPAWSPDGQELAVSIEGSLYRVDPATGRRAPAHGRPGLRLPARLVARRPLPGLLLLPRRRARAAGARAREREELGRSRRTAR